MGSGRAKGQSGSGGGGGGAGNGFTNIWNNLGADGAPLFDADTLMAGVIASVSIAPHGRGKRWLMDAESGVMVEEVAGGCRK